MEPVLDVDDLRLERRRAADAGRSGSDGIMIRPWGLTDVRLHDPDGLTGAAGHVTDECLVSVRVWLGDFLDL